ncbi:substrate-binding domain-containing protein, partial [Spirochaetota bacterium]
SMQVDGMIVFARILRNPAYFKIFNENKIPIVSLDADQRNCDMISFNDTKISHDITAFLIKTFGMPVAHITPVKKEHQKNSSRYQGYVQAFKSMKKKYDPDYVLLCSGTYESGFKAADALLQKDPKPKAVFVYSDYIAMGLTSGLLKNNVSIPGGMGLAGMDDSLNENEMIIPLTTGAFPYNKAAMTFLDILKKRISKPSTAPIHRLLTRSIIYRGSTGSSE